ncbi:MAG: CPBP family glutamic-type intramembrane protease [Planctomycetota bacterium]
MSNDPRKQALIALLLLVPMPSLGTAMGLWIAPGAFGKTIYFICKTWILALPAVWLLWIERGRLSLSPARKGGFVFGVVSGLLISALIYGVYRLLLVYGLDTTKLREVAADSGFATLGLYVAFAAYLTLINAALEEYVWRWFVFTRWERLTSAWAAAICAAACFALHHILALGIFLPWSVTGLAVAGVFVGGVVWCWCYKRYRSIWPGYVSHALVDVAIFIIGWELLFVR